MPSPSSPDRPEPAADDAQAYFERGWRCLADAEEGPDPEQALYWMRRAAQHGHAEATYRLGAWLALSGRLEEAAEWWEAAADQGHALAQLSLGHAYREGLGVTRCRQAAAAWYGRAASQGLALAQRALGALETEKPLRRVGEGA